MGPLSQGYGIIIVGQSVCVHQGIIFNDVYKLGKLKFTNLIVVILCLQCHKQVGFVIWYDNPFLVHFD